VGNPSRNATSNRDAELREILTTRRREIQREVHGRIRGGYTHRPDDPGDELEQTDADSHGDLEFALLQIRTQTLARIEEALGRLKAGTYGSCFECEDPIAERRLRAVPFAVRCQQCEEQREQAGAKVRQTGRARDAKSMFPDLARG
jgi:DnaK suppressor protein